jgi:hypothetical protein
MHKGSSEASKQQHNSARAWQQLHRRPVPGQAECLSFIFCREFAVDFLMLL